MVLIYLGFLETIQCYNKSLYPQYFYTAHVINNIELNYSTQ